MLRIIDRYIGRQVFLTTLVAVLVLCGVLVLGNIFKKILPRLVDEELEIGFVLEFIANILPFTLMFTIPWGFLTAILLTFGRLSADNELISLRMAGLSMPRICSPVFLFALFLSAVCLWININIAPEARRNIKTMLTRLVLEDPMELFKPGEPMTQLDRVIISVGGKEGSELRDFRLYELSPARKLPLRILQAERVDVKIDRENKSLTLDLHNGIMDERASGEVALTPETLPPIQDLLQATPGTEFKFHSETFSFAKLDKNERKPKETNTSEIYRILQEEEGLLGASDYSSFRTELHMRYSLAMACVTFVLIGIPLGVTAQRRETSIGFALSLIVAIVYFIFIIVADTLRDDPSLHPHLLMWAPNIVFLAVGLFLFRRLSKA